jgi:lysozyme
LEDPKFDQNWDCLEDVKLMRGAYLYFHPNRNGKAQAEFFKKQVDLSGGDLPPIVDIEETKGASKEKIKKNLQECLDALEEAYGAKPMIYSSVDFYTHYLGEPFDDYPFWAAHYEQDNEPRTKRSWTIWQHNCKGHVNGIDAEVDFNVVNGSLYTLKGLCL